MNVLVACEESQEVCKAFRKKGHNAFSCDIQEPSGNHPEWHIIGNALEALKGGEIVTMDGITHNVGKWDLLIAHPPCTYLSNAGAARLYKRFNDKSYVELERLNKGFDAKEFFLKFLNAPITKIAVENPIPSGVYRLPKYSQVIQPYEYGHPYSKKTRLWLKGLPPLIPTDVLSKYTTFLPSGTGRKIKSAYGSCKRGDDAKNRSKTFPGIARAMAEQWAGEEKSRR